MLSETESICKTNFNLNKKWVYSLRYSPEKISIIKKKELFSIHGLWPNFKIEPKSKASIKISSLVSDLLLDKMKAFWHSDLNEVTNVMSKNKKLEEYSYFDERFWEHEWINHGQYSGLSVEEYFSKCIELYEKREKFFKSYLDEKRKIQEMRQGDEIHFFLDENFNETGNDLNVKKNHFFEKKNSEEKNIVK